MLSSLSKMQNMLLKMLRRTMTRLRIITTMRTITPLKATKKLMMMPLMFSMMLNLQTQR